MNLALIGYFVRTHGVKGHLVLKDEAAFSTEGLTAIFLDSATGKAPYFITEIRDTNNGLILKLEEVDVVEKARALIGKAVYADVRFVEEEQETADWIGFEIIDKNHGSLGIITGTSHNGSQDLVSLQYNGREVILPLVEEFVEQIDEGAKKIWYEAPAGLVELYLSSDSEDQSDT